MDASAETGSDIGIGSQEIISAPDKSPGTSFGLWLGMIILFVPLFVYIYALCPTVYVGDAGDFLTAAYTLGIPHPPGYPTYTLLGNLFMNLPIPGGLSTPAFRMNLMSAVAAWAACVFMFLALRRILRTEWPALIGALVLAFSRQFWEHAEIAEVYTLQILFLTLVFYLAVLYVQLKKIGWALLMAFFMGLSVTHQYAVIIFYPGVLIFIGMNGGLRLKWHTWALAVILALVGLTPYAYLPLVHYKTPMGEVVFVDNEAEAAMVPRDKIPEIQSPAEYFWDYFTRRLYSKSRVYTHSTEAMPERTTTPMVFRKFVQTMKEDFEYPLLFFALLGWLALIISLGSKKKNDDDDGKIKLPVAAFLPPALGFILYFLIVHFYPSGDILAAPLENIEVVIPPLLIPLSASTAMVIALGFDASLRWIAAYVKSQGINDVTSSQKFRTFAFLLAIAAFVLAGVNLKNAEFCDKSESVISYFYALNVLDSCDQDAILLTTGDETFLFWYVQKCEPSVDPDDPYPGYRKDVWATNWVHNLPTLEVLADEPRAMRTVTEGFIASSTYYLPYLERYRIPLFEPDFGPRPTNSTFVAGVYAESEFLKGLDCVLKGLTYSFRYPGDIPDIANEDVFLRPPLGEVEEGAAPMSVIDIFDGRDFENYHWDGLPRFEGSEGDLSSMATGEYFSVNLEAQEKEVLARYQDSLYRFGIASLLSDTQESSERAVGYLFQCVSLDPDDWFGWKELGDAFFAIGHLDNARETYTQLIEIGTIRQDLDPDLIASSHAQLGHIALIKSSQMEGAEKAEALDYAAGEATIAMAINPDDNMARLVLDEIERQRASIEQQPPSEPAQDETGTPDEPADLTELEPLDSGS